MGQRRRIAVVVGWMALAGIAGGVRAQDGEGPFDLGVGLDVVGANGEPANDILAFGVLGHWRWTERWRVGFAIDHSPEFDVERPYELLGLVGDPLVGEIDASATHTTASGWLERVYPRGGRIEWFWNVGAGVASVDVDDVEGPLIGFGAYDIATDAGTEILAGVGGGLRVALGTSWRLEAALRLDEHFADWELRDRISGRTASVDDYTVRGVTLGLLRRF